MKELTLKSFAIPIIKSIDIFNILLKSHHRRTAIITYYIGKEAGFNEHDLLEAVIAAAMHDIGALSIEERDTLIEADVKDPYPHCIMGYRMLLAFKPFKKIARIIKHHHIKYHDYTWVKREEVVYNHSLLIHLADRIDIQVDPTKDILSQKDRVINYIDSHSGSIFKPDYVEAFKKVAQSDIFWIEINELSIVSLFNKMNFSLNFDLTHENVTEFSKTLARIVDFRSHFTISHSYLVARISEYLGEVYNLSTETRLKLLIAGLLHDIGKIGVDLSIIDKPGKLTEEEYNKIKKHSYYTGKILEDLSDTEWIDEIVLWAKAHHERNDGSGYPYGLTEEDLTMEMKIIMFADVISALMENRPYRGPLSIEIAFRIIEESIAPKISMDMFMEIKKHKNNLNQLVSTARDYSKNEYEDIMKEIEVVERNLRK